MPGRGFRFTKATFFVLLIVIFIVASAVFLYFKLRTDKVGAEIREGNTVEFLLMVGEEDALEYTELVMFQSKTGKCALFDIPSHVGALISSKNRIDRIDTVFDKENPEPYIEQIEDLMGVSISNYLYVTPAGLKKMVDLYEGVDIFIANPVEYTDITEGEEWVLIPSGSVTLDGAKAVDYSLFNMEEERHSDLVTRRQKVIQALLKKIGEKENYSANSEVSDALYSIVSGNFSERAFSSLIEGFSALEEDQFIFQRVLGKQRKVEGEVLLFPHYEGALLKETVEQTKKSLKNAEVMSAEQLNVTIEILNGTMTNGLAGRTSQVFESFGYDVANVSNASNQARNKTVVVARGGNISSAQQVANIIKCKNVVTKEEKLGEELTDTVGNEPVDVTVILGKDFDGRYCKE